MASPELAGLLFKIHPAGPRSACLRSRSRGAAATARAGTCSGWIRRSRPRRGGWCRFLPRALSSRKKRFLSRGEPWCIYTKFCSNSYNYQHLLEPFSANYTDLRQLAWIACTETWMLADSLMTRSYLLIGNIMKYLIGSAIYRAKVNTAPVMASSATADSAFAVRRYSHRNR